MAEPGPRLVSINELRFRPANSNDRARAGMQHAFKDVPDCSFGKDDGISPYMAADAGINDFPDAPASQATLDGDIPDVAQEIGSPVLSFGEKLLRGGFGLSVFLHAVVFCAVGYYATVKLPDDSILLAGETIIAIEFYSETDSEVSTKVQQNEEEGEEEAVEPPKEEPTVEPKQEVVEPVKPVEREKPVVEDKPVETPQRIEQPVIVADQPKVLSTTQPSDFQIEAVAKQILEDTKIEPLPDMPPPMLVTPVEEKKPELEKKLAQPLRHPISKPRVVQKVAEVKPVEKPVEQPVVKKEEPKPIETKPEPKKVEPEKVEPKREEAKKAEPQPEKPVKKKKLAQDGNADRNNTRGSSTAKQKNGDSQDASLGNAKNKLRGNSSKTNYKGVVQAKLQRARKRVTVSGKGKAVVAFTITANGSVTGLKIRKSSGKSAVDRAALEIVRKASPFPAIPPDTGMKSYPLVLPLTLNGN